MQKLALQKAQNLVRGALAKANSRKFTEGTRNSFRQNQKERFNRRPEPINQKKILYQFRVNFRSALQQSRPLIKPNDYSDFIKWSYEQVEKLFPAHLNSAFANDYLDGVYSSAEIPLEDELRWSTAIINQHAEVINKHRVYADELAQELLQNNIAALSILEKSIREIGGSFWAVQLKLALKHSLEGLESQKEYYAEIRKLYPRGFLAFLAYQTSVRNEDRTDIEKFKQEFSARKFENYREYFAYRLINEWPYSPEGLSTIFRAEQSNSVVDLYETFVRFAQKVVKDPKLQRYKDLISQSLKSIKGVDDYRLRKLGLILHAQADKIDTRPFSYLESFLSGDPSSIPKLGSSKQVLDPWFYIYTAWRVASIKDSAVSNGTILQPLINFIKKGNNNKNRMLEIEKLSLNYDGVDCVVGLFEFCKHTQVHSLEKCFDFTSVGVHCKTIGIEDFSIENGLQWTDFLKEINTKSSLIFDNLLEYTDSKSIGDVETVPYLLKIFAYLKFGNFYKAEAELRHLLENNNSGLASNFLYPLLVQCTIALGEREKTISEICNAIIRYGGAVHNIPLEKSLAHYEYSDFKKLLPKLDPIICLYALWEATKEDKHLSYTRYSVRSFLKQNSKKPPSLIYEGRAELSNAQKYFLKFICIPNILDSSPVFSGSRALIEERQSILGELISRDPSNSAEYEVEILDLTSKQKIEEGLKLIDRNRINVDEAAIRSWASRELKSKFDRFSDLISAGIGDEKNFDEVITELNIAQRTGKGVLFTPKTEADFELVELLHSLKHEFLHNSVHGLDAFLSKRIRHQSFLGMIRGPLEFEDLITAKNSARGEYKANIFWLDKFQTLSSEEKQRLSDAFKVFARKFDDLINEVREQKLQVFSEEQKLGMFRIEINPAILLLVRSIAKDDRDIEEFCKTAFVVFWPILFNSLERVRTFIHDELRMQIDELVSELKFNLRETCSDHTSFKELSAKLSKAASEVQTAIGVVESWFQSPKKEDLLQVFELNEAVNIAIEATKKIHKAFTPDIKLNVDGTTKVNAGSLVLLAEILLICFDNVKNRSRLKSPRVWVSIDLNTEENIIDIKFENDVAPGVRTKELDASLAKRQREIDAGKLGEKVSREGGSGFYKIASDVHKSKKGMLKFGFESDELFAVKVHLAFVPDEAPQ